MKKVKQYYKGLEVECVNTYNQYDTYEVEIEIEVILNDEEGDIIDMKNEEGSKQFDKGEVARAIGLKTKFDNCIEYIEDINSADYIFEDSDAWEFLINEQYITNKK